MIYIENEGALFRGPSRAWPQEVWTGLGFSAYRGPIPKDIEWGNEVDENEAKRLMDQLTAEFNARRGSAT